MKQYRMIIAESIEIDPQLTFEELCEAYHLTPDFIRELIDFGILDLNELPSASYRFHAHHLKKIYRVQRLQHELEINVAGAAVVLDLMDELEMLRNKLAVLEKYVGDDQ